MGILNQELREGLSQDQEKDRKEEQEMETGMKLNDSIRDFLKYLVVARDIPYSLV